MQEEGFWQDRKTSERILKELNSLKERLKFLDDARGKLDDIKVFIELAHEENDVAFLMEGKEEIDKLEKVISQREIETLLSGKYDKENAILTIHSGAGGTESNDWVEMLLRMYLMWADKKGYKSKITETLPGETIGFKRVTVIIEGEYAYGYLKTERGIHRLVRISPFDANKRRHTTFASGDVIPFIQDKEVDFEIPEKDLKIDTFRAQGAGGQHVNKTDSAVRITHIPTGIVVSCQNERSQFQNKATALKILKSKLLELRRKEQEEEINRLRGEKKDIAWGSQIRSYIFYPYQLVKDHRTDFETSNINAVMNGEIDNFIKEYLVKIAQGD